MWKENIEKIRKRRGSYGRGLNEGASTGEITALREELKSQYNIELPQGYITFLKYVNGIETNGCIIYGIDEKLVTGTPKQPISGILEMNSIWYEDESQKAYLFLGEDNISWYVYELSTGKFLILDLPSGEVMEKYTSFEEMLNTALEDNLY